MMSHTTVCAFPWTPLQARRRDLLRQLRGGPQGFPGGRPGLVATLRETMALDRALAAHRCNCQCRAAAVVELAGEASGKWKVESDEAGGRSAER